MCYYSVAFYMNPMYPGCLPEWCDMANPIPPDGTAEKREEEETVAFLREREADI